MVNVLIVEDSRISRESFERQLAASPDFIVLAAIENAANAEIDTDFDGRIDRVSFYDNGLIIKTEIYSAQCRQIVIDAPSNEQVFPISTRHYRKGIFTREETDTKCRGKLETVTIFNDKGEVSQVGYDHTGDGIIDEWIRY